MKPLLKAYYLTSVFSVQFIDIHEIELFCVLT